MRSRGRPAYRRRAPVREPYDVVLIVCEGQKTEPNYLDALRQANRLSSVNVRIVPPNRSDPLGIVKFAISEMRKDPEYDRAYCIFDRNGHATYNAALQRARQSPLGKANRLFAISSVPCFEIWLLLHFNYSNAPYIAVGGTSACDLVIRDLRAHFPNYAKGSLSVFGELTARLPQAQTHATWLERHNRVTTSDNPSTQMHNLVKYLTKLKA